MTQATIVHTYRPQGSSRQLWDVAQSVDEILHEGPAGTGKTRGDLEWAYAQCEDYPGTRGLFMRDTRKSMNDTVLVCWESEVVPPGHPILVGPKKEHRDSYKWPTVKGVEGAEIVLGSMEHIERVLSGQFDWIIIFEAKEVRDPAKYEVLLTRLRNFKHPKVSVIICETNPGPPSHWLNTRGNAGKMTRLYSRHEDNPVYFDPVTKVPTVLGAKYMARLDKLTGAQRANYRDGVWRAEEGQVWENYDPAVHECYQPAENPRAQSIAERYDYSSWGITGWYGSMDFGWTKPGCFQLWGVKYGVDGQKIAWRVCEIYYTKRQIDWWADRICDLYKVFKINTIWADAADPEAIEKLNDRLGPMMERGVPRIVLKADKAVRAGIDTVSWALGNQRVPGKESDPTRMYFCKDAHWFGVDQDLVENLKPTGWATEVESYVYPKLEDGKVYRDEPDPKCEDHACDSTRYFAMGIWNYGLPTKAAAPPPPPGSIEHFLGHRLGDVGPEPFKWRPGMRG